MDIKKDLFIRVFWYSAVKDLKSNTEMCILKDLKDTYINVNNVSLISFVGCESISLISEKSGDNLDSDKYVFIFVKHVDDKESTTYMCYKEDVQKYIIN